MIVMVRETGQHAEGTRVEPILDVSRIALAGIALGAWSIYGVSATIRKVARVRVR